MKYSVFVRSLWLILAMPALSSLSYGQPSTKPWCVGIAGGLITATLNKDCDDTTLGEVRSIKEISVRLDDVVNLEPIDLNFLENVQDVTLYLPNVKQVPSRFFKNGNKLTSISLSEINKVNSLPDGAFAGLPGLKSISIRGLISLNSFSNEFFSGADSVENLGLFLQLTNGPFKEYPDHFLDNLADLKSLSLSIDSVEIFDGDLLKNLHQLQNLEIRGSFSNLPQGLFKGQKNLQTLTIQSSKDLVVLPGYFVKDCSSLKSLNVRVQFISLPENFLTGAENLEDVKLPFAAGDLFNQLAPLKKLKNLYFGGRPFSEVNVSSNAFQNNAALETVYLSGKIRVLPARLFAHLPALKSLQLMISDLETVGDGLLEGSTNVQKLILTNDAPIVNFPNDVLDQQENLELLSIRNLGIDLDLGSLLKNKPLIRDLNICGNKIRSFPIQYLAEWKNFTGYLDVSLNPMPAAELGELHNILKGRLINRTVCTYN